MKTIRISELGNNIVGLCVFNNSNQVIKRMKCKKENKRAWVERLRNPILKAGESVFCDDQTVCTEWLDNRHAVIGGRVVAVV